MFLLVPAHPGCPGQIPQSSKTVMYVCVCDCLIPFWWHFSGIGNGIGCLGEVTLGQPGLFLDVLGQANHLGNDQSSRSTQPPILGGT